MKNTNRFSLLAIALLLVTCGILIYSHTKTAHKLNSLSKNIDKRVHYFDVVDKKIEDTQWFNLVGDVAYIDKVRLAGPPRSNPKKINNAFDDQFIDNDLIFQSYVFIPKIVEQGKKYPLIVFSHGGIHGTFSNVYAHVVKELIAQGYIIIAPDYRGSIGYGQKFRENIDYGGLENEDVLSSRDYMVENYSIVDSSRVGLLGWSHGGMISLMNVLKYPSKYACAYAGVPVSDVIFRLAYMQPSYTDYFTADYHIGQTVAENPEEYRRRSPSYYANQLEKPLMITTTENDDDVSVLEVQRMIDSLKHHNKDFEYTIYEPKRGAHLFDRIDIKEATDIRFKAYKFLDQYLLPPSPFENEKDMRKAGYRFN